MDLLNHDLDHEFPQYRDKMRSLRVSSTRFAHLVEQFDATNTAVTEDEQSGGHLCDENLEDLKKKRLLLKDEIYQMLQKSP
jgi:uncharacterized protein YdcH (DUF465 family)